MEPLKSPTFSFNCGTSAHLNRRSLLHAAALGGLSWITPLANQLSRATERGKSRPKSLIVIWLEGGASQLETFDPHPGKSIAYGALAIPTAVKGLQFGEGLERTAALARDFSILRSVTSLEGDHTRALYNAKTGYRPFPGLVHPAIGAVLCHEMPVEVVSSDLPRHISILPGSSGARGGYLGAEFDAFQIGDPQQPVPDVTERVTGDRAARRLSSLSVLEQSFAAGRRPDLASERTLHQSNTDRARRLMSSEQLASFDISAAAQTEREAYGDHAFGRGCFAALRLIQAGVRCVEVTLSGWDSHVNNRENQRSRVDILDPALAALITGLKSRDLYKDTIVLVATEFGRTPKQNVAEGRDHWPHGFSVLIGGGGLAGGQVIGQTDPAGEKIAPSAGVHVEDIHTTILTAFGVDYTYELMTPIGRPLAISDGKPIPALLTNL